MRKGGACEGCVRSRRPSPRRHRAFVAAAAKVRRRIQPRSLEVSLAQSTGPPWRPSSRRVLLEAQRLAEPHAHGLRVRSAWLNGQIDRRCSGDGRLDQVYGSGCWRAGGCAWRRSLPSARRARRRPTPLPYLARQPRDHHHEQQQQAWLEASRSGCDAWGVPTPFAPGHLHAHATAAPLRPEGTGATPASHPSTTTGHS